MKTAFLSILLIFALTASAQTDSFYLFKPARVFDGENMHTGWVVLVKGNRIEAAGAMNFKLPANTRIIELPNATLLPGLIEGHSHLFLHPYNEVSWDDQVLRESRAERTARAVNHARATLKAGFTTVRDLGTEGAAYDDAGLKKAIEKNVIPGPRMIVATRAIVARGSYGPKSESADVDLPQGAEEVSGAEEMARAVRTQMSRGADIIKVYADYRYGPDKEPLPAFTEAEWKAVMEISPQRWPQSGGPRLHTRGHEDGHTGRCVHHRARRPRHR
ncbi:MAG TPA: amidohydrolase family protein [Flavisolibacter sp.]|jgi:imidazolonepropionase-like amidohydrolase